MKVLIIGDADSIWIKSVIQRTLIPFGDQVELLTINNSKYNSYYESHDIRIHYISKYGSGVLRILNGLINRRVFNNHFDVIHIHFAAKPYLVMLPVAKKYTKRTIVSFWGSDILRSKKRDYLKRFCLKYSDAITLSTEEMERKFHEVYGGFFNKKLFRVSFGSNIIEEIERINIKTTNHINDKYDIPNDKIKISIGYNASSAQQHDKVLNSIKTLPKGVKKSIHIIMRLTYGRTDLGYIQKAKDILKELDCTYTIFEDYLTNTDIAELTTITDIFINSQISDARSASMCEHLFAGCLVLNPSWIRYAELQNRVYYLEYKKFSDIPRILQDNLSKKNSSPNWSRLQSNRDYIYKIASWESVIGDWRKVYEL